MLQKENEKLVLYLLKIFEEIFKSHFQIINNDFGEIDNERDIYFSIFSFINLEEENNSLINKIELFKNEKALKYFQGIVPIMIDLLEKCLKDIQNREILNQAFSIIQSLRFEIFFQLNQQSILFKILSQILSLFQKKTEILPELFKTIGILANQQEILIGSDMIPEIFLKLIESEVETKEKNIIIQQS